MDFSVGLITPVILCGGFATANEASGEFARPKPLQKLAGNLSSFQQTLLRVSDPGRFNPPMIVADLPHHSLIQFEMEMVGIEPSALILEPVSRGTGQALTLAALVSGAFSIGNSLLVMPCDHLVRDPGALISAVDQALVGTRAGALLAFGAEIETPEAGRTWMQKGSYLFEETRDEMGDAEVYWVARFVSKNSESDTVDNLDDGEFFRNSGMYLFPVASLLSELRALIPDNLAACQRALIEGSALDGVMRPALEPLEGCSEVTIVDGIMAQTEHAGLVPTGQLWSDDAIAKPQRAETSELVSDNIALGNVFLSDASGVYAHSAGPLTAVIGMDNVVVVNSGDAVVVAPRDQLKTICQDLEDAALQADGQLPAEVLMLLKQAADGTMEPQKTTSDGHDLPAEDDEPGEPEEISGVISELEEAAEALADLQEDEPGNEVDADGAEQFFPKVMDPAA